MRRELLPNYYPKIEIGITLECATKCATFQMAMYVIYVIIGSKPPKIP
jgi:hypothetical protein